MVVRMDSGVALRRFGLCGGPTDLARLGGDPLAALLQELAGLGDPPAVSPEGLLTTDRAVELYAAKRSDGRRRQAEARSRAKAGQIDLGSGRGEMAGGMENGMGGARPGRDARGIDPSILTNGQVHQQELEHLLALAVATPRPLEERLVLFWTNHFTVSAQRLQVAAMVGAFEREAVRAHLAGRFEAMLLATALHPAMLRYLDNADSVGPNSPTGRRRRGNAVNENLAREIMELHTLGVDGGYSQADVTEFARALSGWTAGVWLPGDETGERLGTFFDPDRHEPGTRRVLGRTYADSGAEQAPQILRDLAAHPSTIRHVTRQLVRHFVGDAAPPALQPRLAQAWTASGGSLPAVMEALLRAPEAWEGRAVRLRSPLEFVMASCRVVGMTPPVPALLRDLGAMGQPVFNANSPKGWPEEDDGWVAPDGVKTRLDWAINVAARAAGRADPRGLAEQAFGPALTDETRTAMARAESPKQGLAILLMSPEMQRR